jgi:hypothetical protein
MHVALAKTTINYDLKLANREISGINLHVDIALHSLNEKGEIILRTNIPHLPHGITRCNFQQRALSSASLCIFLHLPDLSSAS